MWSPMNSLDLRSTLRILTDSTRSAPSTIGLVDQAIDNLILRIEEFGFCRLCSFSPPLKRLTDCLIQASNICIDCSVNFSVRSKDICF